MNFHLTGLFQTHLEAEQIRNDCDGLIDEPNFIRGIMITGDHKSGKTTLLKDFLDSFDCDKFTFPKDRNITKDKIEEIFNAANRSDRAVIYIDDITPNDALTLSEEMDELDPHVIVIATRTPEPKFKKLDYILFGEDAFNREIIIPTITGEMVRSIIESFFEYNHLNLNKLDLENCISRYSNCNYFDIKNALDIAFAAKGKKLNIKDVHPSIPAAACRVTGSYVDDIYVKNVSYQTCISEAGHIVMACHHYENTQFDECYFLDEFTANTSICHYKNCIRESMVEHKRFDCPYFEKTCIQIAMAGYLSEKVFFNTYSGTNAIKWIREINDNIDAIVKNCYFDPIYNTEAKHIEINRVSYTNADNKSILKLKRKIFKKLEKKTLNFIKTYKDEIRKVADYLYEFKQIDSSSIRNIIPIIYVDGQKVFEKGE